MSSAPPNRGGPPHGVAAWWLGFASFGLMFSGRLYFSYSAYYPTHALLTMLSPLVGLPTPANQNFGNDDGKSQAFFQIGHSLLALMAAVIGGFLASTLFGARRTAPDVTNA